MANFPIDRAAMVHGRTWQVVHPDLRKHRELDTFRLIGCAWDAIFSEADQLNLLKFLPIFLLSSGVSASAATLYSNTFTGAELTTRSDVNFHVSTTLQGDSVVFSQDDPGQVMFDVSLLEAAE